MWVCTQTFTHTHTHSHAYPHTCKHTARSMKDILPQEGNQYGLHLENFPFFLFIFVLWWESDLSDTVAWPLTEAARGTMGSNRTPSHSLWMREGLSARVKEERHLATLGAYQHQCDVSVKEKRAMQSSQALQPDSPLDGYSGPNVGNRSDRCNDAVMPPVLTTKRSLFCS